MNRLLILAVTMLVAIPPATALLSDIGHSHAAPSMGAGATDALTMLAPPERSNIQPEPFPADQAPVFKPGPDAAEDFGVRFVCPTVGSDGATGQEVITTETCPYMLRDEHDIMSQPTLMIEPSNPECMAFHAMHGGRGVHAPTDPQPPSTVSRHNGLHQPHTVWRTCNGGGWEDNPYYAPDGVQRDGRQVFGEENAATQDREGNMVIGGVLAYQGPGDASMQYMVYVHRLQRVGQQPGYLDPQIIETETPGAVIKHLQMAYVKETDMLVLSFVEETEIPGDEYPDSQVRTFHSQGGRSGGWTEINFSDRIGPCKKISDMVPRQHVLFVACSPAPGYFGGNGSFEPRYVQVHQIDTRTWSTWRISEAKIDADLHLKMIDGYNGWQLLFGSGVNSNGRPFAMITFGALGDRWSDPIDYATEFMQATQAEAQGQPLIDARITAAVHDDTNALVYVIWAEQYEIDPTNPATIGTNSLAKMFGVVRARGGFLASLDLSYGMASRVVSPQAGYQGGTEEIFWDSHDDIIRWRDPRGGVDRIFVAMGDYGTVRVAEAVPENPPPPIPFPPAVVPAIPLAAASGTTSALSVALAAALGLMLLRLLAAKKKVKVETPTI